MSENNPNRDQANSKPDLPQYLADVSARIDDPQADSSPATLSVADPTEDTQPAQAQIASLNGDQAQDTTDWEEPELILTPEPVVPSEDETEALADSDVSPLPAPSTPAEAQSDAASASESEETLTELAGDDQVDNQVDHQLDGQVNNEAAQARNTLDDPAVLHELDTTVVRRHSLLDNTAAAAPVNTEEEPVWQPRPAQTIGSDDTVDEQTLLAGASIKPAPISRASAHWAALFTAVLAVPLAWACFNHAFGLLYGIAESTWNTGKFSVEGLGFFTLGLVALVALILTARLSSLGSFVMGTILTLLGLPFVVTPTAVANFLTPYVKSLDGGALVPKLLTYFTISNGAGGLLVVWGILLLGMGIISHSARRQGRQERVSRLALDRAQNNSMASFS